METNVGLDGDSSLCVVFIMSKRKSEYATKCKNLRIG